MDSLFFAASVAATCLLVKSRKKKTEKLVSLYEQWKLGTSLNATERVCTVTADNIPLVGGHNRSEMRLQKLWHRATYCLIRHEAPHLPSHPKDDIYVLVQKRSTLKDYCPGKLDPTPGGVVGYGEDYQDNLDRELQEEMGIDTQTHALQKLFTFPYEDDTVKVWGEFYECTYRGTLHDLKLQKEEVERVLRMDLQQLKTAMKTSPHDFMPDSIHALQLYFQHQGDLKVNRRFLKGSSSDLNHFLIRPPLQAIFFDCDDCLYFDHWTTAKKLTAKIDEWCVAHGLKTGQAYQLYKQYGTALRGLLAEGYLEDSPQAIDAFLEYVHDIGVDQLIKPDPKLRQVLQQLDPSIPRYVFTASVAAHARRCLVALGIEDCFESTIIDTKICDLETKHSQHSFQRAMQVAGVQDPEACLFFDDNVNNLRAARRVGWRCVLVGKIARDTGLPIGSEDAELELSSIHDIPKVLPELFGQEQ